MAAKNEKNISFMDRVKAYAEKVKSDGWENHGFDDRDDFCQFIGGRLDSFPEYVLAVVRYDNAISLAGVTLEGEEFRDRVTTVDRSRKLAHDCAIDAVNMLNRAFARAGMEPFADVDTSNRHAVADFAGRFTIEAFDRQIYGEDHAMDRAVMNVKDGSSSYGPRMRQLMRAITEDADEGPSAGNGELSI